MADYVPGRRTSIDNSTHTLRASMESSLSVRTTIMDDDEENNARSPSTLSQLTASRANLLESFDVDAVIRQLLQHTPDNQTVHITQVNVVALCAVARSILLTQPMLLELGVPLTIIGDIHGQYHDLIRHFESCGFPPKTNYLFLGDYVDRGPHSVECICLLMAFKIKYPENFFIMRGNHECSSVNRIYGFFDECKRRYSFKIWKVFNDVFNCLPVAAVIEDAIFCSHGGISPDLTSLDEIRYISRPSDIPKNGILCDLVWSDPDGDIQGWGENDRGVSYTFGADVVRKFLDKHTLSLIVRAHQVVEDGYQFFADRRNYCGEFDNAAAAMCVDENLTCSFKIIPPKPKAKRNEKNEGKKSFLDYFK